MGDLENQVAGLKATVESGFEHQDQMRVENHAETRSSLREINGKVNRATERVSALDASFEWVKVEIHNMRVRFLGPAAGDGENRHLTMRDVYVFVAGITMFYAVAKLFKWLP